ncbi:MAG: long-chain fatty acid--CoA ligase [Rikenellaceae bacterium]|nr:long-chain fatty acid--CoA ligase [Rikenellaceae bacterium]
MTFNTLKEVYDLSVAKFASKVVSTMHERETLTYTDFRERVEDLQKTLLEAGLSAGDKVALLSSSMPNWTVSYFAVTTMGMIVVPILPGFSSEEFGMILTHSESKALLVSDRLYSKVPKEIINKLNIVVRTKNLGVIFRGGDFQPGTPAVPQPDDTAAIIYTSGTTSSPKGVMLSHRALAYQIEGASDLFPIDETDRFLSILPMSHVYECSIGMLYPFALGATVTYMDRPPTASALLPVMRDAKPTIMLSVPLVIDKIYRSQVLAKFTKNPVVRWFYGFAPIRRGLHRIAGKKLMKVFGGELRFFGIGGAKLDPQTEQFLYEAKFPYAIGYGLTETAPLLAGKVPYKHALGSTGVRMKGVELRIADPNSTGEGELQAKTPSVMQGYYKNPEATAEAFTEDGWFRTKDSAIIDEQGTVFIKGRMNSMLIGPSGENIYPEDIESVLNSHTYVSESIVTEEDGKLIALVRFDYDQIQLKYQELKGYINDKTDQMARNLEEIADEVKKFVNERVASFSRIAKIEEQAEEFEKTPSMKIKRFKYDRSKKNVATKKTK